MTPGARLLQDTISNAHPLTFEDVVGFDDERFGPDREPVRRGDRCRSLLSALHRRGDDMGEVVIPECIGGPLGHLVAEI